MQRNVSPQMPMDAAPRARIASILRLALPIIGGMVSQNIFNLVDTAMVGTLGDEALAGVGIASYANFMAIAFITGLSTGVQAMAARRLGQGRVTETAIPLNGGLIAAAAFGIPWSALLYLLTPALFPLLAEDQAVCAVGVPYLQARLVAAAAVGMNFSFRGFWNGTNRSGLYMRTLLLMHAANILFNWLLIFGRLGMPQMGSTGAGVGSAIATWLGTLYYIAMGFRHAQSSGFLRGIPDRDSTKTMLRLAVPSGLQQFLFASGYLTLFWIIGKVGTKETAAANVLVNVMLVVILPGLGLGMAAASLVGQALGRGQTKDAQRWGWDVVKIGLVILTALGLPMVLFPETILGAFLHDPSTVAVGRPPLRLVGSIIGFEAFGLVLMHALLGAGASRQVMVVSVLAQWVFFLPAAFVAGPMLGFGLMGIWVVQAIYRLSISALFVVLWQRGTWKQIKV